MSYPKYVNIQTGSGVEKMFFSELIDRKADKTHEPLSSMSIRWLSSKA